MRTKAIRGESPMPFQGRIVPTPEPVCKPDEADVLEMWLEAIEEGIAALPPSSLWREVGMRIRPCLLADLGRPHLRPVGG